MTKKLDSIRLNCLEESKTISRILYKHIVAKVSNFQVQCLQKKANLLKQKEPNTAWGYLLDEEVINFTAFSLTENEHGTKIMIMNALKCLKQILQNMQKNSKHPLQLP